MIKVMHIVLGLEVGGLETFVLNLIGNYPSYVQPVVVCLERKGELARNVRGIEILELRKKPGIRFSTVLRLLDLIISRDIDIIHTHNPSPHFYGAVAGFLARRRLIHTKHGRNYPSRTKNVLLNRISSVLTDEIIAVSENAAHVCVEVEKVPASKVTVILNGIDTTLFHPQEPSPPNVLGPVRIGIVARLSPEKDHLTLLRACGILATGTSRFRLDIIGDGPLREALEQEVVKLGLERHVSFTGTSFEVADRLRDLDIFALSSTTEGISLTLLEAMACALPVVATNVGGNPEVVCDGITGFLVSPQDPQALAEKLSLLINDQWLRRKMGGSGRKRVLDKFSISETSRKYEDVYQSVLKNCPRKVSAVSEGC